MTTSQPRKMSVSAVDPIVHMQNFNPSPNPNRTRRASIAGHEHIHPGPFVSSALPGIPAMTPLPVGGGKMGSGIRHRYDDDIMYCNGASEGSTRLPSHSSMQVMSMPPLQYDDDDFNPSEFRDALTGKKSYATPTRGAPKFDHNDVLVDSPHLTPPNPTWFDDGGKTTRAPANDLPHLTEPAPLPYVPGQLEPPPMPMHAGRPRRASIAVAESDWVGRHSGTNQSVQSWPKAQAGNALLDSQNPRTIPPRDPSAPANAAEAMQQMSRNKDAITHQMNFVQHSVTHTQSARHVSHGLPQNMSGRTRREGSSSPQPHSHTRSHSAGLDHGLRKAGDIPYDNKGGSAWLWVTYVLESDKATQTAATALLIQQGHPHDQREIPLRTAQNVITQIHAIMRCPLQEEVTADLFASYETRTSGMVDYEDYVTGIQFTLARLKDLYQPFRVPSSVVVRRKRGHAWQLYEKVKKLGAGAYGEVYLAKQRSSGRHYVLKSLRTTKDPAKNAELIEQFKSEFDIVRKLHHLCVLRVFEMFVNPHVIVMEFASGGDLVSQVNKATAPQSEEWIAGVLSQVLSAVSYCHDRGVAHQDLKPDNILLSEPVVKTVDKSGFFGKSKVQENVPSVVVSDFGQASVFGFGDGKAGFQMGDPRYSSPAAWKHEFEIANDIWSAGATLYELLSGGALPFIGVPMSLKEFADKDMWDRMYKAVCRPNQEPNYDLLSNCSKEARDLVRRMLEKDSRKRPTAAQCLKHPWFEKMRLKREKGQGKLFDAAFGIRICHRCTLQKHELAMLNVFMMNIENTQLSASRYIFDMVDESHTGFVSLEHMKKGLDKVGLRGEELSLKLYKAAGVNTSRMLEFDDFVLACWDPSVLSKDSLESLFVSVFARLDNQAIGHLTRSGLRYIFPDAIVQDISRTIANGRDKINYAEFRDFFVNLFATEARVVIDGLKSAIASGDRFGTLASIGNSGSSVSRAKEQCRQIEKLLRLRGAEQHQQQQDVVTPQVPTGVSQTSANKRSSLSVPTTASAGQHHPVFHGQGHRSESPEDDHSRSPSPAPSHHAQPGRRGSITASDVPMHMTPPPSGRERRPSIATSEPPEMDDQASSSMAESSGQRTSMASSQQRGSQPVGGGPQPLSMPKKGDGRRDSSVKRRGCFNIANLFKSSKNKGDR